MSILRLFGKGLRKDGAEFIGARADRFNLLAARTARTAQAMQCAAGGVDDLQYAELGWQAELRGDLKQAYAIYELLAQRDHAANWINERRAAVAAAMGRWPAALEAYEQLSASDSHNAQSLLVLGHLLLLSGRHGEACEVLERGVELLLEGEDDMKIQQDEEILELLAGAVEDSADPANAHRVQTIARRGVNYLCRGRFVRAAELFEDALNVVDLLLVAHGQWLLAQSKTDGGKLPEHLVESVTSLTQLSDLLLQYLARTKLAGNVAAALRERQLRHDLASWATGCQEVQTLLRTEKSRLKELAAGHPNHAELFYRIGICSRATGEMEDAAKAFGRVLAIQPHHTKSAVRLAATLLQLHRSDAAVAVLGILESAFALQPSEAQQYHALAVASTDAKKFDRALAFLARDLGTDFAANDVKANLAFTLGMLGVKDSAKDEWRNPQPCTTGA